MHIHLHSGKQPDIIIVSTYTPGQIQILVAVASGINLRILKYELGLAGLAGQSEGR